MAFVNLPDDCTQNVLIYLNAEEAFRCEVASPSVKQKFVEDVWNYIFRKYRFSDPLTLHQLLGRARTRNLIVNLGVGGVKHSARRGPSFRNQIAAEDESVVPKLQTEELYEDDGFALGRSSIRHFHWFHDFAEEGPQGHKVALEEFIHTPRSLKNATIVLTGDRQVGITSICDMFTKGFLPPNPSKHEIRLRSSYLYLSFGRSKYQTPQGVPVKLTIKEKRGSAQRTPFSWKLYEDPATAAIIVFDVTRRETLGSVDHHLREVLRARRTSVIPMIIVGSKADAKNNEREVSFVEAAHFSAKRGLPYCEISTLDGDMKLPFLLMIAAIARSNSWIPLSRGEIMEYQRRRLLESLRLRQWLAEEES